MIQFRKYVSGIEGEGVWSLTESKEVDSIDALDRQHYLREQYGCRESKPVVPGVVSLEFCDQDGEWVKEVWTASERTPVDRPGERMSGSLQGIANRVDSVTLYDTSLLLRADVARDDKGQWWVSYEEFRAVRRGSHIREWSYAVDPASQRRNAVPEQKFVHFETAVLTALDTMGALAAESESRS